MVFREASQSFDRIKSPTQQRRRKKGAAPSPSPPTVFSKAPCRPTALSSHNGILGLSSNYLRDKRSDDVEWRKITSRSHGERLLLVEERGSTAQNRERSMQASTGEGAAARISAVRSAALVRALHVLQTIGDCTLYLIDSPQTCVTTTRYCL